MNNVSRLGWKDVLFCSGDLKTKLLKIIDYYLGGMFCYILRPKFTDRPELPQKKISRILIIRPGGIGDAVLILPLIKEVKRLFAHAKLDILAERRNARIFVLSADSADNIFYYDRPGFLFTLIKLKRNNYDIVFDSEQWHTLSAVFSYFVGKKIRVGFDTRQERLKFYTHISKYKPQGWEVENFLNLLRSLLPDKKIGQLPVAPFINLPTGLTSWASQFVNKYKKTVALCLGSSIKERNWDIHNFHRLIEYAIAKGYQVWFLGDRRDRKLISSILSDTDKKEDILDFVGRTDLSKTAALVSLSDIYIGLDSGVLHLAYALGVPTISLFGPGIKDKWAPRGRMHIALKKDLPCSPCTVFGYTRRCAKARCMQEINVDDVIWAIEKLRKESCI